MNIYLEQGITVVYYHMLKNNFDSQINNRHDSIQKNHTNISINYDEKISPIQILGDHRKGQIYVSYICMCEEKDICRALYSKVFLLTVHVKTLALIKILSK